MKCKMKATVWFSILKNKKANAELLKKGQKEIWKELIPKVKVIIFTFLLYTYACGGFLSFYGLTLVKVKFETDGIHICNLI